MIQILVIVTPNFNAAATMAFVDPFRASNYLEGGNQFRWRFASLEKSCVASNGAQIATQTLDMIPDEAVDFVAVSSSWTPETAARPQLLSALRKWARKGSVMVALDTGAFILAQAGLLSGKRATVHYEHIDALKELHPDIEVSEDMLVQDGKFLSCSGGLASADMALHIIAGCLGAAAANAAARYIFHARLRPFGTSQNPSGAEPLGNTVPEIVKRAIALMEKHLEDAVSISRICTSIAISHRQLDRLFRRYVGKAPALYYRDIRLDRARGLVTQTDMLLSEVAMASGFSSQVHFSRAYRARFGLPPRKDRIEGRIPFEYRAWPMHRPAPPPKD